MFDQPIGEEARLLEFADALGAVLAGERQELHLVLAPAVPCFFELVVQRVHPGDGVTRRLQVLELQDAGQPLGVPVLRAGVRVQVHVGRGVPGLDQRVRHVRRVRLQQLGNAIYTQPAVVKLPRELAFCGSVSHLTSP